MALYVRKQNHVCFSTSQTRKALTLHAQIKHVAPCLQLLQAEPQFKSIDAL